MLLYGSTVGLLLKRDTELLQPPRPHAPAPGSNHAISDTAPSAPHTAMKTPKSASHHHHHHHSKHKTVAAPGPAVDALSDLSAAAKPDAVSGVVAGPAVPPPHRAGALLQRLLHFHLLSTDMPTLPGIGQRTAHLLQVR